MSPVVVWPEEETERVEVKWHYYSEENCLTAEKQPVEAVEKLKQEAEPALLPSKFRQATNLSPTSFWIHQQNLKFSNFGRRDDWDHFQT